MIYFLNSTNRVYKDTELNKVASLLFSNGVFNTKSASHKDWATGGDFLVEAPGVDMNITARAGSASVQVLSEAIGQQVIIQEDVPLSATVASNASLALRMDTVVLRVNQNIINTDALNAGGSNAVSLVVISGNGAGSLSEAEIAVALSGDPYVRLADIAVPFGATAITADMVTDVRQMVEMTRTVKAGFDSVQFIPLTSDPDLAQLKVGDIWYNQTDDVIKFYNGVYVQALQLESFDWGYYPPNGLDTNVSQFEAVVENTGEDGGLTYHNLNYTWNVANGTYYTFMSGQVFKLPASVFPNPFIQVKMGATPYPTDVAFDIYTVNGSDNPSVLVQAVGGFSAANVPQNDYVNLYLDGSLFAPDTKYILVAKSTRLGQLNAAEYLNYTGQVQISSKVADANFISSKTGYLASLTTNPVSPAWSVGNTGQHYLMRIASRDELVIGETDGNGNTHKVVQSFTAKSRDIIGFRVIKGTNIGTPTGSLSVNLYAADQFGNPTGDVITSATIAEVDWTGVSGTEHTFPLQYDSLVVGSRYAVVLDTEFYTIGDNYTVYFGNLATGNAKRFNTINNYVELNGDLFFSLVTSASSKIVVTAPNGKIPSALIDYPLNAGVFTKNLADATLATTVIPHGLGRAPSKVKLHAKWFGNTDNYSISDGVFINNVQSSVNLVFDISVPGSPVIASNAVYAIYIYGATTTWQAGSVTVDETNITITWTKTGAPTGNAFVLWEAE